MFALKLGLVPWLSLPLLLSLGCGGGSSDNADEDEAPSGSSDLDVSPERVERMAEATCERDAMCTPEVFALKHEDVAACTQASLDSYVKPRGASERRCTDAALDAAECFVEVPCDGDANEACADEKAAFQAACE